MTAATQLQAFALDAFEMDGVSVSQDEETIVVDRELTDGEPTTLGDVLDVAHEFDLVADDLVTDLEAGEMRAVLVRRDES